jgi:TolB-like protein
VNSPNFFAELKRRNVYKTAVTYAVVSWLLIQIATQVFPIFDIPNWAVRVIVLLLVLGFPVALVLAWAFEITPEGIKRTEEVAPHESITHHTGRKLVGISVAVAVVAAGMLALQLFRTPLLSERTLASSQATGVSTVSEKSIAVLPFDNLSSDRENAYFTDGVQDEILTHLSKIADLRVISRISAMQYKSGVPRNLRKIGEELRVAHVVEGSVQRIGGKVRVNAQLMVCPAGRSINSSSVNRATPRDNTCR